MTARPLRITLWTLRKNRRRLTAELLRLDTQYHIRFFAQGVLFMWHPCETHETAMAYADVVREDLEGDRWDPRPSRRARRRAARMTRAAARTSREAVS